MEKYFGVNIVYAELMNEHDFLIEKNGVEEFEKVKNNRQNRFGYKVMYGDFDCSWMPKDVFENSYRKVNNIPFGVAIEFLKQGKKVARTGWNGKGMWLKLAKMNQTGVDKNALSTIDFEEDGTWSLLPCICMKTETNEMLPGWVASKTDMLAEDWVIVD